MSCRLFTTISLYAFLLMVATVTVVDAADWRVAKMSGQVYVQRGPVRLASLSAGLVLKDEAVIVTKKNGRAILVRGEQTMIVAPNSIVTLPADSGRFTRILERIGQVEYNVDHRLVRHFTVETPYLAAVVKGTRFKVRVYKGGASVSVLRGRVEVTSVKTGERVDVLAGQRAAVGSAGALAIDGTGKIQPIKRGQPLKQGKPGKQRQMREASASPSSIGLGNDNGATASVGGDASTASVSTRAGGASASVGGNAARDGAVSVDVGGGLVSAEVNRRGSAGGDGGVSVGVGRGTVSVGVDRGGVSVGVGGLSVGIR